MIMQKLFNKFHNKFYLLFIITSSRICKTNKQLFLKTSIKQKTTLILTVKNVLQTVVTTFSNFCDIFNARSIFVLPPFRTFFSRPATRCICTWCWLRTHQFNQLMKPNHLIYNITFNCFDCEQTKRTILMCFTRHHHFLFSPPTTIINENGLNEV